MLKSIILAAFVAISATATAQVTKQIKVGAYDEISVSGSYTVELVAGTEGNITVTGEQSDIDHLIVKTDGTNLIIKPENWKSKSKKSVTITVPVKDISEIALGGSGSITSQTTIKAETLEIALSGSGRISLDIDAKELQASMSGSGKIELKGNSDKLESSLSGSGKIQAFDLNSDVADANISGSGETQVRCSKQITARISGSGRINYKGNPEKEDTKVSGSGKIVKS